MGDAGVLTNQAIAIDTTYLCNWSILGRGDAASWEQRLNGVPSVLTPDAPTQNRGPIDIRRRDSVTPASLIGPTLAFGPGISRDENRMFEALLANEYGIAM